MTVFITIPWFLPAFKAGGPIQSVANLVENFNEGIEYRIFCGNADLNNEVLNNIKTDEWVKYNDHTQVWYASENIKASLIQQTEELKPDVLFIIGIFSWYFNIVPLLFCKAKTKILSVRGMLHPGALSQKKFKKRLFLNALKITGIIRKIVFHATDDTEAGFIKNEFGPGAKVAIAANYGKIILKAPPLFKVHGSLKLITVALISPMKNHLQVLGALATCTSVIEYNIYGPVKDEEYWKLCLQAIEILPGNVTVKYHGEVPPATIGELLAKHHVFIMPSKSENFGHAIFEALSAGKPVITSHATPWNDLQMQHAGINTLPDPEQLKKAIEFFALMDNAAYLKFADGAAAFIERKTNKEIIAAQYRSMFQVL